jgi:large subunit ribosomal protein L22
MEYVAIAKNIKIIPRKMRLVVDGIKKQNVKNAISNLTVMNKRAANPLKKVINSALANAKNNFGADVSEVTIKDIIVTEGVALKRYHFAARGRVRPYKRRSSQIRVVLSDNKPARPANALQNEVKSGPAEPKALPETVKTDRKAKSKGKSEI